LDLDDAASGGFAGALKGRTMRIWSNSTLQATYVVCDDGELNGVARVQAVAAALNLRHVEEEFFALVDLVVEEAELALDGVNDSAFLVANGSDLK
jgi:hypothetical protein